MTLMKILVVLIFLAIDLSANWTDFLDSDRAKQADTHRPRFAPWLHRAPPPVAVGTAIGESDLIVLLDGFPLRRTRDFNMQ